MNKTATLFRMHTEKHICPFGLKSKHLLKRKGYQVIDKTLNSREKTDQFKETYGVDTTPQTFIDDKRVGGYESLRDFFNLPKINQGETYTPVVCIFIVALLLALAFSYSINQPIVSMVTAEYFVALSMIILAVQKLRDIYAFSNSFITYDLLAMKFVPYAYIYPFLEAYAGLGMIAGLSAYWVAPISLFIGGVGAVSVFKAVYIDKRDLKCACAGGNSRVPLGFVSLTENLFMVAAGLWMLIKYFI